MEMHEENDFSSSRKRLNSFSLLFWCYIPSLLENL